MWLSFFSQGCISQVLPLYPHTVVNNSHFTSFTSLPSHWCQNFSFHKFLPLYPHTDVNNSHFTSFYPSNLTQMSTILISQVFTLLPSHCCQQFSFHKFFTPLPSHWCQQFSFHKFLPLYPHIVVNNSHTDQSCFLIADYSKICLLNNHLPLTSHSFNSCRMWPLFLDLCNTSPKACVKSEVAFLTLQENLVVSAQRLTRLSFLLQ
jgi:hypothetical protein